MLASCGPTEIYKHKEDIHQPWTYADSLVFNYAVTDTLSPYDLFLTVEHSPEFKYENLYINAVTQFPDGNRSVHPVSLQLVGDDDNWIGKCSSTSCKAAIHIAEKAYFKQPGDYKLVLEQYSRSESLDGIISIQLQILKAKIK